MEDEARFQPTQMQLEQIMEKLRANGCRITRQRKILLKIILGGECASCKEIYYRASREDPSIGTATVYRMVNALEQIGAISRRNMYKIDGQETGRLPGEEIDSVIVEFADGSTVRLSGRQLLRAVAAGMTHQGIPVSTEVVRLVPEEK